jgi:hypothetical protein
VLEILNVTQSQYTGQSGLDQLQNYLLVGNKEDACKVAISQNLWIEALIISRHVGPEFHTSTLIEYFRRGCPGSAPNHMLSHPALQILLCLLGSINGIDVMKLFANEPTGSQNLISNWSTILGIVSSNKNSVDVTFLKSFAKFMFDSGNVGAGQIRYSKIDIVHL